MADLPHAAELRSLTGMAHTPAISAVYSTPCLDRLSSLATNAWSISNVISRLPIRELVYSVHAHTIPELAVRSDRLSSLVWGLRWIADQPSLWKPPKKFEQLVPGASFCEGFPWLGWYNENQAWYEGKCSNILNHIYNLPREQIAWSLFLARSIIIVTLLLTALIQTHMDASACVQLYTLCKYIPNLFWKAIFYRHTTSYSVHITSV